MAPARPPIPERLAIVFPIDSYDAWNHLANGYLYLPSTATTATGVMAIGLTGNLTTNGPLGMFWEDEKAILVMPGKEVQRLNRLAPIQYANVDALIADNFRAMRRIVDQPFVSFIATYVADALLRASSPALAAAVRDPLYTGKAELTVGIEFIERAASMSARQPRNFYKALYDAFVAEAGNYYTFNQLMDRLNRFAPRGAEILISMLPAMDDAETVVYWGTKPFGKTIEFLIEMSAIRGNVSAKVANTIKMGDLKRGAAALRSGVSPELRKILYETLTEEGMGFSGEVEWLANPTPDRRTGGLSVFMNVPPNSILYLIGRNTTDANVESKVIPLSLRGMWVIGIPPDSMYFDGGNPKVLDALYDYENGITNIKKLRAEMKKLEKKYSFDVLEPNPYWIVRG